MQDELYHNGATRGQSVAARRARLERGACPIHGINMPQIGEWQVTPGGIQYALVGCPRRDCQMRATVLAPVTLTDPDEIIQALALTPECEHVLVEEVRP